MKKWYTREIRGMSKVTAKYQITIPIEVRKSLGIVPGCEIDIKKMDTHYVLVVDPIKAVRKKWRGIFKDGTDTASYIEEIRGTVD